MDERLAVLAEQGSGLFLTQQAYAVGLDDNHLMRLRRAGQCFRLTRGLYVVSTYRATEPEAAHLQLARGGLLLYPDAALSHDSALIAHGFPVWKVDPHRAHLIRPVKHQVRRQKFVIDPWWDQTTQTDAGRAVTPAAAVVQTARTTGLLSGVVAADHGLHEEIFTTEQLAEAAETVAGWPDSAPVTAMLELADRSSESPGESRCRVSLTVAGFDLVPQVTIRDEHGTIVARVDFLVKGTKVVLEFDGKVKYASGDPTVLWGEKRREDRLRELGYTVIRVTWADLENPGQLIARIRTALAAAA